MIALIVAAVLIGVTICTTVMLEFKNNKKMQNRNIELLRHTNELGIVCNLSFSSQEVFKGCAIGLDGKHRKLLIVEKSNATNYDWHLIDLDNVINCTLKKTYRSIKAGELEKRSIEEYLETINLRLEFLDHREPIEIPFYAHDSNKEVNITELERKARRWQIMLSKMLKRPYYCSQ
jgi:hypothetical protein